LCEPALYRATTPQVLIDEYLTIGELSEAAHFFGCSVFDLLARDDWKAWLDIWERRKDAQHEVMNRQPKE
jgi:hypothetical protein